MDSVQSSNLTLVSKDILSPNYFMDNCYAVKLQLYIRDINFFAIFFVAKYTNFGNAISLIKYPFVIVYIK